MTFCGVLQLHAKCLPGLKSQRDPHYISAVHALLFFVRVVMIRETSIALRLISKGISWPESNYKALYSSGPENGK